MFPFRLAAGLRPARWLPLLAAVAIFTPAAAQSPDSLYQIKLDEERPIHVTTRDRQGKPALFVTVQFQVLRGTDGSPAGDVAKDEIFVEEDGRRVKDLDIFQPRGLDPVTVVLALDISGSMNRLGKMDTARQAAGVFLDAFQEPADCGLILFDHQLRTPVPPAGKTGSLAEQKEKLRRRIASAEPAGGTAYLDAAAQAIEMLRKVRGRKAVLLMTDGIDLNSQHTAEQVIRLAREARVPLYTLGVGEPGVREPVTTVLALDQSESMRDPVGAETRTSKMEALRKAAGQFVRLMRPGARTTLLPFSTTPETPQPFTDDKATLLRRIGRLEPGGRTALRDATLDAVETLAAARLPGKRAVVVLTDGEDTSSIHRREEVIERARETGVVIHTLGFGRPQELDENDLRQMAVQTGGEPHLVRNDQALFQAFENLAIKLYDEGIDEPTLLRLADQTGGKYYPARDISKLQLIYQDVAQELQTTWTVTFPSQRQSHDGTARGLKISVVRGGRQVSDVASLGYTVHGVVVPQMDPGVYLVLLALLGALLAVPAGMRRLFATNGSHGR